ncbi:hypothetical protein [Novosphingobium sp. Leaf2]|uniref:hypothetical protein n=1 Tax=Novosphingobium sp. Leaf2 TaxID=1735670 RepID=UPI0006FD9C97|nr:hypothetical protein [Novosphingobium sp. Leaf2]KQM22229.1 hypothetical protein ASE49_02750 [Novosphingobium sp. Leaf2]
MKTLAIAATLALGASVLGVPVADARPKLTGEEQLAKILQGRQAGKPVTCIPYSQTNNVTLIDKTALVYRVGGTVYVNRPTNADQLNNDEIMVTKLYTSQLCRLDTIQLRDRFAGHMWRGFVSLQDFVPYTKVPDAK